MTPSHPFAIDPGQFTSTRPNGPNPSREERILLLAAHSLNPTVRMAFLAHRRGTETFDDLAMILRIAGTDETCESIVPDGLRMFGHDVVNHGALITVGKERCWTYHGSRAGLLADVLAMVGAP